MERWSGPKACFYRQMRYLPERWGTHFSAINYFISQTDLLHSAIRRDARPLRPAV